MITKAALLLIDQFHWILPLTASIDVALTFLLAYLVVRLIQALIQVFYSLASWFDALSNYDNKRTAEIARRITSESSASHLK